MDSHYLKCCDFFNLNHQWWSKKTAWIKAGRKIRVTPSTFPCSTCICITNASSFLDWHIPNIYWPKKPRSSKHVRPFWTWNKMTLEAILCYCNKLKGGLIISLTSEIESSKGSASLHFGTFYGCCLWCSFMDHWQTAHKSCLIYLQERPDFLGACKLDFSC